MPSTHAFLIYCGIYAVAIAMPGPGVISLVARALGSGFRATIPAVIGTAVGEWVLMSLCVFGLALVARELGSLFLIIKLGGAAYLVYLAWRYWNAPVSDEAPQPSPSRGFAAHMALTVGNPKAIGFFVALLPNLIALDRLNMAGYALLSAATFVLLPAITLSYVALASRVRVFLQSARARKRINRSAAAIMAGAGVAVAVS